MKRTHSLTILAGLAAMLLLLPLAAAADEHIEREIKIKIVTDAGEALDLDLGDLEVGDTRQFFTDDGTEVTVTRTEAGYQVEVDGETETLFIPSLHGGHGCPDGEANCEVEVRCEGDPEDCERNVFVRKHVMVAGDGEGAAVFHGEDGEHVVIERSSDDMVWVGGDEEGAHVMIKHMGDPAQHLIDSGVLDDLPEAKRQEILDALRAAHPPHGKRIMKIKSKEKGGDGSE